MNPSMLSMCLTVETESSLATGTLLQFFSEVSQGFLTACLLRNLLAAADGLSLKTASSCISGHLQVHFYLIEAVSSFVQRANTIYSLNILGSSRDSHLMQVMKHLIGCIKCIWAQLLLKKNSLQGDRIIQSLQSLVKPDFVLNLEKIFMTLGLLNYFICCYVIGLFKTSEQLLNVGSKPISQWSWTNFRCPWIRNGHKRKHESIQLAKNMIAWPDWNIKTLK